MILMLLFLSVGKDFWVHVDEYGNEYDFNQQVFMRAGWRAEGFWMFSRRRGWKAEEVL